MAENINFPKKVVIDASVALAFLLPDEKETKVDLLFLAFTKGKTKIIVPGVFYFEVFNGLRSAVLSKRIKSKLAQNLLINFLKIKLVVSKADWLKCFRLALKEKISYYDASYLSLAKKEKIPLFTLDKLLKPLLSQ